MAPHYDPPKDVPSCTIPAYVDHGANVKLMGPNGSNLKRITEMLNLNYVWLNMRSNTIELYGNENKLEKATKYFKKYLETFYVKHCSKQSITVPKTKKMRCV